MNLTLQSPWLLLLLFPTLALVAWLGWRARFPLARTGLYALVVAGLVLILAGPVYLPHGDRIPVVYLVDHSASIPDFDGQLDRLDPLFSGANAAPLRAWSDPPGWWLFGRDLIVLPTSADLAAGGGTPNGPAGAGNPGVDLDRSASLYGSALDVLRRWAKTHPDGCALLCGDGQAQDEPEALAQAGELRRLGWVLDTFPAPAPAFDLAVVAVDTPSVTRPGEYAPIRVRVRANAPGHGRLRLEIRDRDGKAIHQDEQPVTFASAGEEEFLFGVRIDRPAVYRVKVRLADSVAAGPTSSSSTGGTGSNGAAGDAQPGNDIGYQLLTVRDSTLDILHVLPKDEPSAMAIQLKYMAERFPSLHWKYRVLTPDAFQAIGGVPRGTRLLILEDLPKAALIGPLWQSIDDFVEVEGGGVLALGGPQAFGAGGHRTGQPFERCLPIKMEPPKNRRIDVVIIVDVSASMDDQIVESAVRSSKLEAAKEAVWGLLGGESLLGEKDRIALITFSDATTVRLPFTPVGSGLAIKQILASLAAEGATTPAPAVEKALDLVADDKADKVFLVFVSDGQPSSSGAGDVNFASRQNERIVDLLRAHHLHPGGKITFWPVFIGEADGTGPYRATLQDFARNGGGQFIWPKSAGNPQAEGPQAPDLVQALRHILDEGDKDRFVSTTTFLVLPSPRPQTLPNFAAGAEHVLFHWRNRVGVKPDADALWQALPAPAATPVAPVAPATAAQEPPAPPPETIAAAGEYGNGRSAAIAMPFNSLAIQAGSTNPHLADQLIAWVNWLTGAHEHHDAWLELRAADNAMAHLLHVQPGQRFLNIELAGDARRSAVALECTLHRIPMEDILPADDTTATGATAATAALSHLPAQWIAPGRFALAWPIDDPAPAVYSVEIDLRTATGLAANGADSTATAPTFAPLGRFTVAVPAGPEYLETGLDLDRLSALATSGGGRLLTGPTAADAWRWQVETQWRHARAGRIARQGEDLRGWLAALLALLLILDTAARWFDRPIAPGAPPAAISDATAADLSIPGASTAPAPSAASAALAAPAAPAASPRP
ncbi:MAG: VWA domain-containing protein [Planctomycetota bacterium]